MRKFFLVLGYILCLGGGALCITSPSFYDKSAQIATQGWLGTAIAIFGGALIFCLRIFPERDKRPITHLLLVEHPNTFCRRDPDNLPEGHCWSTPSTEFFDQLEKGKILVCDECINYCPDRE